MCQKLRHVLSLCPLNLILLPSYLSNREGICYSSLGVGSACQFASSCKAFRMKSLIAVCALTHFSFVLLLLEVFLGSWGLLLRLWLVYIFLKWICIFFLSFWIHPWIPSNQSLVFGTFDSAHHHQLILLMCEGFHELCKIRNLPGLSCQLGGMEGKKNNE